MSLKKKSTRMYAVSIIWVIYSLFSFAIALFLTKDYTWLIVGQINATLWFIGAEILEEIEKAKEIPEIE